MTQLPAELLRKGRFDELFFVDLPNHEEREAIWRIQMTMGRRGAGCSWFDLQWVHFPSGLPANVPAPGVAVERADGTAGCSSNVAPAKSSL